MSRELTDTTGAHATVEVLGDAPIRSYAIHLTNGSTRAGRADFVEADTDEHVRIFFHTEVDPAFIGRGLAGLLIRTALSEAIDEGIVVVPVCPLFAEHLRKHGTTYLSEGGRFRTPRPTDIALVQQAVRGASHNAREKR